MSVWSKSGLLVVVITLSSCSDSRPNATKIEPSFGLEPGRVQGKIEVQSVASSAPMPTPMAASTLKLACSEDSDFARGFCDAAIDAHYSNLQDWCVPGEVTHGEVSSYVQKELKSREWIIGMTAFEAIRQIVHDQWPCV